MIGKKGNTKEGTTDEGTADDKKKVIQRMIR